jgi:hypothetical protein
MSTTEWIEYGKTWENFEGADLNRAGTVIQIATPEGPATYMIGDVNTLRGVCDDCTEFRRSAVVQRYAVVWRSPLAVESGS